MSRTDALLCNVHLDGNGGSIIDPRDPDSMRDPERINPYTSINVLG